MVSCLLLDTILKGALFLPQQTYPQSECVQIQFHIAFHTLRAVTMAEIPRPRISTLMSEK